MAKAVSMQCMIVTGYVFAKNKDLVDALSHKTTAPIGSSRLQGLLEQNNGCRYSAVFWEKVPC